jgi:TorA maturation chaperone TorD
MEANKVKEQNSVLKAYNMLLYFSGSMIMYEPVEECVVDFWSNGILKALPVKSSNPRFVDAASQLRDSCNDRTSCRRMLQEDFNKLFIGSGLPLAPPLKSNYIDIFELSGSWKEKASDFYNSYGWQKRLKYNVPDDNLGIELLFLTLLTDRYISFDDEACRIEMGNEIRRFIKLHILSWLPEWNERMQEYAGTLCYKGIATLIYACCEDIYDLLYNSKPETNFTAEFRN